MPVKMPLRSLLLAILFLPTTLFYYGLGTSLAPGVGAAALLVVLVVSGQMRRGVSAGIAATIPILLFVIIHLLVAGTFLEIDFGRAFVSLVPLLLMIVAGVALGRIFLLSSDVALVRGMNLCFFLMCVSAIFGIIGSQPPAPRSYAEPVFPFTEPSHFALIFAPVLMFCYISSKESARIFFICLGLAVTVLLQSLTLAVGLLIIVIVGTRGFMLPLMAVLVVGVASLLDLSYYTDRLNFAYTQNMSALVYIQGWQLLYQAFVQSHGWGIGFQQFGLHDAHSDATDALLFLTGNNVNILDGGFFFAKLAGEFGFIGVAVTLFFLAAAVTSFFRLKQTVKGKFTLTAPQTFAYCVLLAYPMELFVRGQGYFTPTALLVISSLRFLFVSGRSLPKMQALQTDTNLRG